MRFETYTADADLAPLMKGLPDDRCQCPHMGYVLRGRVTFRFADRELLNRTTAVVMRNLEGAGA